MAAELTTGALSKCRQGECNDTLMLRVRWEASSRWHGIWARRSERSKASQCRPPYTAPRPAPQLLDLKQNAASKWAFRAVDGSGASMDGVLASQVARALQSGELRVKDGDVVRVTGYACNSIGDAHKLVISCMEAVAADSGTARDQAMPDAPATAPIVKQEPQAASTPVAATKPAFAATPGPTPSPSEE
jgi:hypothetical protein